MKKQTNGFIRRTNKEKQALVNAVETEIARGTKLKEAAATQGITTENFYKIRQKVNKVGSFKPKIIMHTAPQTEIKAHKTYTKRIETRDTKCIVIVTSTAGLRDVLAGLS